MKSGRSGLTTISLVIALLVVISLIGAFVLTKGSPSGAEVTSPDVFEVRRGGFDITIPASGELAALNQTEVSSRLESRATITFIVDEGTMVKKGDVLIRLNDEDILNNIKDAEDTKNTAEAAWITAKSDLDIHVESSASQLAQANVDVKLAELSLLAWQEGDNVSKQQTLTLDVETSKKDYDRLQDRFEQSKMLLEQEFISKDEYSRDEIDMIRARSKWQQAKLALEVYAKYTAEEERERLSSDHKQAEDRRSETEQRNENKRVSLAADLVSKSSKLEN
ncbi:MAG: HlyD family secretion protein, partial [Planctomycetota bacterium]